jgi:di/tricarboxylate transporter
LLVVGRCRHEKNGAGRLAAITGVLTPTLSIPTAAAAVLLLGCVKVTDIYKSVDWQAVATAGGMISFGLALEKTGAAGALGTPWSIHDPPFR